MNIYIALILLFNACNHSMKTDTKINFVGKWSYTRLIANGSTTKFNKGSDLIFTSENSGYFVRLQNEKLNYQYKVDDSTLTFELTETSTELFFSKERQFEFEIKKEDEYQMLILKSKFNNENYIFVRGNTEITH